MLITLLLENNSEYSMIHFLSKVRLSFYVGFEMHEVRTYFDSNLHIGVLLYEASIVGNYYFIVLSSKLVLRE